MFQHFSRYPWVLQLFRYDNLPALISALDEKAILPLEEKLREVRPRAR